MLAKKIKVAYPVLLVMAGLGISFIPGTPKIHIEPELIFFIFLPPLLYEAAWGDFVERIVALAQDCGQFCFRGGVYYLFGFSFFR